MLRIGTMLVLAVGLTGCAVAGDEEGERSAESATNELAPNGKGGGVFNNEAKTGGANSTGGMVYNSGAPVMTGTVNVYYIWYGNWSGNTATTILPDLIPGLSGSPYFHINTGYYQTISGVTTHVSGNVNLAGQTTDNYSRGTALADADVSAIVSSAITSGKLPSDNNALYFVLTSADVNETGGMCTKYCGWHNHTSIGGKDIKYSFVGNPDRCPSSCAAQTTGPNGNAGADGMASIMTHELEEAITDPDLNAWHDRRGNENADKCAWTFGTESTASNGAKYNVTLGSRNWLIQQNWVLSGTGYCAMSAPY